MRTSSVRSTHSSSDIATSPLKNGRGGATSKDVGKDIAHSPGLSLGSPSASVEFFGQLLEAISRLRIALA